MDSRNTFIKRSFVGNTEDRPGKGHTRNDREDEREAEEEKWMTIEVASVQSTQTISIGAGSEFLRLEYRHDILSRKEDEQ